MGLCRRNIQAFKVDAPFQNRATGELLIIFLSVGKVFSLNKKGLFSFSQQYI
jgi:hypothetical protein